MPGAMKDHASTTIKVVYAGCACSGSFEGTGWGRGIKPLLIPYIGGWIMELYEQGYGLDDFSSYTMQDDAEYDVENTDSHGFERVVYVTIALLALVSAAVVYITFV